MFYIEALGLLVVQRRPLKLSHGVWTVADEGDGDENEIKRGPKGGRKHKPGRGHRRRSEGSQRKAFQKKARRKRELEKEEKRMRQEQWDRLSPEVQKFLPNLKPKGPSPNDEN
jgi:hypothetical protein